MDTRRLPDFIAPPANGSNSVAEFRAQLAERQAEASASRLRDLGEQASNANPPGQRIRIWERLHQVALPLSPNHRVLRVIATATGLTVEDIRAEQRERSVSTTKDRP